MNSTLNLESIRPLVRSTSVSRGVLRCVFACPETGAEVNSEARLQQDTSSLGGKIQASAKKTLARSLKSSVGRSMRGLLGNGVLGRLAGDAAKTTTDDVVQKNAFSREAQDRALLEAFSRVADRFRWEEAEGRWVAA